MTHVFAGMLCLHLSFCDRKNKDKGSRLVRGCWCNESRETCPLHVLGPVLDDGDHASQCAWGAEGPFDEDRGCECRCLSHARLQERACTGPG